MGGPVCLRPTGKTKPSGHLNNLFIAKIVLLQPGDAVSLFRLVGFRLCHGPAAFASPALRPALHCPASCKLCFLLPEILQVERFLQIIRGLLLLGKCGSLNSSIERKGSQAVSATDRRFFPGCGSACGVGKFLPVQVLFIPGSGRGTHADIVSLWIGLPDSVFSPEENKGGPGRSEKDAEGSDEGAAGFYVKDGNPHQFRQTSATVCAIRVRKRPFRRILRPYEAPFQSRIR